MRTKPTFLCGDTASSLACPRCGDRLLKEHYPGALYCEREGCGGSEYEPGELWSPRGWRDRHGDVWTLGSDGLLHTPETRAFPREHVEKKWGPLVPNPQVSGTPDRVGDKL